MLGVGYMQMVEQKRLSRGLIQQGIQKITVSVRHLLTLIGLLPNHKWSYPSS